MEWQSRKLLSPLGQTYKSKHVYWLSLIHLVKSASARVQDKIKAPFLGEALLCLLGEGVFSK
jgi:hypothetical protein